MKSAGASLGLLLVDALTGPRWEQAHLGVADLWEKAQPEYATAIRSELSRVRDDVLQARLVGDVAAEQAFANIWESRLQTVLRSNPDLEAGFRSWLMVQSTDVAAPVNSTNAVVHGSSQSGTASEHSTIYNAHRDVQSYQTFGRDGQMSPVGDNVVVGSVIGSSVTDNRARYRVRIGRLNLGLGGFVALVVLLIVGVTSTVVVVNNSSGASISELVGTWQARQTSGNLLSPTTTTVTLLVKPDATWSFTFNRSYSGNSIRKESCVGTVEASGQRFNFTSASENKESTSTGGTTTCQQFTAMIAENGARLSVQAGNASFDLRRAITE